MRSWGVWGGVGGVAGVDGAGRVDSAGGVAVEFMAAGFVVAAVAAEVSGLGLGWRVGDGAGVEGAVRVRWTTC